MKKLISFKLLIFFCFFNNLYPLVESEVFPELVYKSALKEANLERLEQLLEEGQSSSKIDSDKMTPLAYAVKNNNKKMIELLLQYKANINSVFLEKITHLLYSVMLEKSELIKFLFLLKLLSLVSTI